MSTKLTPNSISGIIGGEMGLKPIVQVLDIETVGIFKYNLVISDSVSTMKAYLASQLEDRLKTGQIRIGSVVRIICSYCTTVHNRKNICILSMEIIVRDCEKIGNPKPFGDSTNSGCQKPGLENEIKRMRQNASGHSKRIFEETEKLKSVLDNKKKDLEMHVKELKEREADNERERRKLIEEKKKLIEEQKKGEALNTSLEMATLAQQGAAEAVLELVEVQKKEKDDLNIKHDLELEIVHLRGKLNVMGYMVGDKDGEVEKLRTMIKEKEGELEKASEKLNTELKAKAKSLEEKEELKDGVGFLVKRWKTSKRIRHSDI